MPGSGYRFAFNGKEKTDEWNGEGNIYDYGFRIYDPRIAKFLSVDPLAAIGAGTAVASATAVIPEPTTKIGTAAGLLLAGIGLATQGIEYEEDPNKIKTMTVKSSTTKEDSKGYEITPPTIK